MTHKFKVLLISLTPGSSDLDEHKLSWEGDGETRPGKAKTKVILQQPKQSFKLKSSIIIQLQIWDADEVTFSVVL